MKQYVFLYEELDYGDFNSWHRVQEFATEEEAIKAAREYNEKNWPPVGLRYCKRIFRIYEINKQIFSI